MATKIHLTVMATLLLLHPPPFVMAQQCSRGYACLGTSVFQGCYEDLDGNLLPRGEIFDCRNLSPEAPICSEIDLSPRTLPCVPDNTPSCEVMGAFPILEDCRRYYVCMPNGGGGFTKQFATCDPFFEFNVRSGQCTPIGDGSVCGTDLATTLTPEPSVGTTTGKPTPTSPLPPTTSSPSTAPPRSTNIPTTPSPMVCTARGRTPDPTSCRHYFQCRRAGARKVRISCGRSMLYDVQRSRCRRQSLVQCNGRPLL